jgi:hypothetical protein
MITATPPNPIWDALGAEADQHSTRRPNFTEANTTRPRSNFTTKLTRAWLSGYMPLLLLWVCFSKGYLVVAAPMLAWIVLPLVTGKHGLSPSRLLLMLVPVMLVPPAYLFQLGWFQSLDPRAPMRNSYLTISYQEVFASLFLLCVMLALSYVARRQVPWFEQTPSSKIRILVAIGFIGLPLFILGANFFSGVEDQSVRIWEHRVAQRDPYLKELRLIHHGLDPWTRLEYRSGGLFESWESVETLSGPREELLQEFESQALRLCDQVEKAPVDRSTLWSAEFVLTNLLRHHTQLAQPMKVLSRLERLRMLAGIPKFSEDALVRHCQDRLSQPDLTVESLQVELAELEGMISDCPTSIVQNDRRWYSARKDHIMMDGPRLFLDLDRINRDSNQVRNIKSWIEVRPLLESGADLYQLETSSDRAIRVAAGRLLLREANLTHERGAKPLWEFYALLYRIKIFQLETGAYPETLEEIGLPSKLSEKWAWVRSGQGGTFTAGEIVDREREWVFR